MSAVTTRALAKSFSGKLVLSGLDLEVPDGNITAILGSSGCGKTTLLRIIAGFVQPDAGVVRLGGKTVFGSGRPIAPQHRRVGYVPQEGALFPHLDVAANIAFGLRRADRHGHRISQMLDLVELPASLATRYPHELSGGQQQRVAVARALAPEPTVVLLDEPFSSLDAALRESTGRSVVNALRTTGATAVLVTHDQSEALSLADQIGIMRDGRLVQVGSPFELYRAPVDADVAVFVGGATVLPAHVVSGIAHCALGQLRVAGANADGDLDILIRPEQIQLGNGETPGTSARVADVSFYGHDASVHLVVLPGGPNVLARVVGASVPAAGAVVSIQVDGPVMVFDPASRTLSTRSVRSGLVSE